MSIYSVLRHRANVTRATKSANGDMVWQQVHWAFPCLVSTDGFQEKKTDGDATTPADGSGLLMAAPNSDLLPGDRVFLIRGGNSQWRVLPQGRTISTLTNGHHDEFRIEQVKMS